MAPNYRVIRVYRNVLESAWKKPVMVLFEVLFWHLPIGTQENHESSQSGSPVSGTIFEFGTSEMGGRKANHSTETLGFWKSACYISLE
jgi:hypothetical protein